MSRKPTIPPGARRASREFGDGTGRTLAQKKAASDSARRSSLRNMGLTVEEYEALLAWQGRACYACRRPPKSKRLAVDHDHACCGPGRSCGGCVRALLCSNCNTGDFRWPIRKNEWDTFGRMAEVILRHPAQMFLRDYRVGMRIRKAQEMGLLPLDYYG